MKLVLSYLKNKSTIIGIFMIVIMQILFVTIFMSGFKPVLNDINKMTVAIVNEDPEYGVEMAAQFSEQLPFEINSELTLDEAQEKLDKHDIHMIIHFPADFSEKMSSQSEQVQLNFYIDQSGPQMTGTAMQSVATQIAGQLEQSISSQMAAGILKGMSLPEEQAAQFADQIVNKLNTNIENTNSPLAGLHNMMAPMFLTMSLYIGAMTFSMLGTQGLYGMKREHGLWKTFGAMLGGNALISLLAPLVGLAIYFGIFQSYSLSTMTIVWLSHALAMFTAICFTSVISFLAGQASTFVQTPLLMLQIIGCGAMMTQDMMPGLFRFVSHISVMYYSVQSNYALLFTGEASSINFVLMAVIAVVSAVVGLIIFSLQKADKVSAQGFGVESAA